MGLRLGMRRGLWDDIHRAPDEDVAVLETHHMHTPFLKLAYQKPVDAVGSPVAVIGSPLGLSGSVASRLVSRVAEKDENGAILLQLNVSANPGNSGGPVMNSDGKVIGVLTSRLKDAEGIAFALPTFILWHYDEFKSALRPSQPHLEMSYMSAPKRRRYLLGNLVDPLVQRLRQLLDYCLQGRGMAPSEEGEICTQVRKFIGTNAPFLVLDSGSDSAALGMQTMLVVFSGRPEGIAHVTFHEFASNNLQVVKFRVTAGHNVEKTRVLVSLFKQDPLAWF